MNRLARWLTSPIILLTMCWLSAPALAAVEPEVASSLYLGDDVLPPLMGMCTVDDVTTNSATLTGAITSFNSASSVVVNFEYGTTAQYAFDTSPESLKQPDSFVAKIEGLKPDTTYHFRAIANGGSAGTTVGSDQTFTTLKKPSAVPAWVWAGITGVILGSAGIVFIVLRLKKNKKPRSLAG